MWNTEAWTVLTSFIGHDERVNSVQLSQDNHAKPTGLLLSAGSDRTVKYWDSRRSLSYLSWGGGASEAIVIVIYYKYCSHMNITLSL